MSNLTREIPSSFVGNAGEFFVLAELTRRGWTAALTARNHRAYDILAKRGDDFAAIRVKTKTSAFTLFQWNAKPNGDIFLEMTQQHDFCVLVDIPEEEHASPRYFVVPTPVIDKWLKVLGSRLRAQEDSTEQQIISGGFSMRMTT